MNGTVHVVARYLAKSGHEAALKSALTAAIPPTRSELGCYRFDLMENTSEPREFCFIERWDDQTAHHDHLGTPHVKKMLEQIEPLIDGPVDVRLYRLL